MRTAPPLPRFLDRRSTYRCCRLCFLPYSRAHCGLAGMGKGRCDSDV